MVDDDDNSFFANSHQFYSIFWIRLCCFSSFDVNESKKSAFFSWSKCSVCHLPGNATLRLCRNVWTCISALHILKTHLRKSNRQKGGKFERERKKRADAHFRSIAVNTVASGCRYVEFIISLDSFRRYLSLWILPFVVYEFFFGLTAADETLWRFFLSGPNFENITWIVMTCLCILLAKRNVKLLSASIYAVYLSCCCCWDILLSSLSERREQLPDERFVCA